MDLKYIIRISKVEKEYLKSFNNAEFNKAWDKAWDKTWNLMNDNILTHSLRSRSELIDWIKSLNSFCASSVN